MKQQITNLDIFIEDVVTIKEGARNARYEASFAGGDSGLSFGAWQNDVAANSDAKTVFNDILLQFGLSKSDADTIVAKAATAGVDDTAFTHQELTTINDALSSAVGQGLVNQRDADQRKNVIAGVNAVFDAAARNPNGPGVFDRNNPDPEAVALVANWINRTGNPTKILDFVEGKPVSSKDLPKFRFQLSGAADLDQLKRKYFRTCGSFDRNAYRATRKISASFPKT